jgi:electron transport complex protein RnfD
MSSENLLHISSSPHIRHTRTVPHIMRDVVIALLPALIASIYFFGLKAILISAVAVGIAMITEEIIATKLLKRVSPLKDWSAGVTGLLVAFNMPVGTPLWMVGLGSFFAIAVAKWSFGGLGFNFVNPALAGRAFLLASYPAEMTGSIFAKTGFLGKLPASLCGVPIDGISATGASANVVVDVLSSATPLAAAKEGLYTQTGVEMGDTLYNLFIGNVGGSIGETSALALLLGGIYLIYRGIIGFTIPTVFVATVFLFFWIFNGTDAPLFSADALTVPTFHVLAGGLLLGAIFMATDMVTSPITPKGQAIFAFGGGVLVFVIRKFGGYPEGVSYSILLMNLVSPLIDRYVKPRVYGKGKI